MITKSSSIFDPGFESSSWGGNGGGGGNGGFAGIFDNPSNWVGLTAGIRGSSGGCGVVLVLVVVLVVVVVVVVG